MLDRITIKQQLSHTLKGIDLPALGTKIPGKVRDCYVAGDKRVLITSDRLSAFDRVLTTIPFKGQLLNQMAAYWFEETRHIVPNHIIAHPHPNVFIAHEVAIVPVEVVIRGYLTGSAWRDYEAGRPISGITVPPGMRKSEQFKTPLITPSTKAAHGEHDEPISSEQVVATKLVDGALWEEICSAAMKLFLFGSTRAQEHGLILVDTKYEFGVRRDPLTGKNELLVADEIHTQDSSRYWILESYADRFRKGEDPHMLDKEFVRRWLIEQGYMGDGTPPAFSDEFRVDTAIRYIEAYEKITGREFKAQVGDPVQDIEKSIRGYLS